TEGGRVRLLTVAPHPLGPALALREIVGEPGGDCPPRARSRPQDPLRHGTLVDSAAVTPASGGTRGAAGAPVGIVGLGAYVPERVMANDEWSQYVDTSDEWIRSRTGIERRRVAAPEQSTVDLALPAARLALEDAGIGPRDVDEIIVATDTPEGFIPDTAAFITHAAVRHS